MNDHQTPKDKEDSSKFKKSNIDELDYHFFLQKVFHHAGEGIVILDKAGKVLNLNHRFEDMFEFEQNELIGKKLDKSPFSPNSSIESIEDKLLNSLYYQDFPEYSFTETVRYSKSGDKIPVVVHGTRLSDSQSQEGLKYLLIYYSNVSKRTMAEAKAEYLSLYDTLTGVYNRDALMKIAARHNFPDSLPITVIFSDINGLKLANDAFGVSYGDKLLIQTARLLQNTVEQITLNKEKDQSYSRGYVGRFGGDEFLTILTNTSYDEAQFFVKQIERKLQELKSGQHVSKQIKSDQVNFNLSISMGISVKQNRNSNLENIIKQAEDKMIRQKLLESDSSRTSNIQLLKRTLQAKSFETKEHSWRLTKMAVKLGKSIELTDDELSDLVLLASLHDIGKIGISEDIIKKPGKLTEQEWEEIKKHPEIGYRIIVTSRELNIIAESVLAHHERYDGQGYPQGLVGENIPLLARIISIIDAYDVMTYGRPYKTAVSNSQVIKELQDNSGKQFDPYITREFIKLIS